MSVARWLETDSLSNQNIASAAAIGAYTADADRMVVVDVSLDQVAGNGDYVIYVTRQINGAGSAYVMLPKTTCAAASGETAIAMQSGMISVRSGDVLTVYVDGLAGDTATPDTVVRFFEVATLQPTDAGRTLDILATGEASANVTAVKDTLLTESVAGRLAAALSTLLDVATPVLTAASVNQSGDAFARLGAPAGANVSADVAAVKADTAAVKAKTDNLPASPAAVGSAMTLTAAYDAAKTAATQASVDDLPTNAELATALAGADDAVLAAIGSLNNLSSAQAQSAAAAALSAYNPATKAELDSAVAPLALETTALSVKAKTDNLPSDPADQSELLAAIAGVGAGSAPTKEEIRAEIDANSVRLAAIQLVTDAIDVSEVTLAPVNVLGHLTITAALTFETSITGIVTPQDWTNAVWTLKRTRRDLDTASIIKLVESNPGVGTDGVTVLNGAAPVSPLTAAAGALTIDAGAGTAGIRLTDDLTALLAVRPGLIWGLKFLRSNGDSKEYAGTADIDLSVVHGV